MANYQGDDIAFVIAGGYDLRPSSNEIVGFVRSAMLEDLTVFGVADQVYGYAGLRKAAITEAGFYDDAALARNAALAANLTGNVVGMIGLATNVQNKPCTLFKGMLESTFERIVKVGAFTRARGVYSISGEVEESVILWPLSASAINSNSTSIDGGAGNAPSTFGMAAGLAVTALTLDTATGFVVKLQDSADNASFADITSGAFTSVNASITTTPAAPQRIITTGNVRRYVRALWTWTGGAGGSSTATFVVTFYRALTVAPAA